MVQHRTVLTTGTLSKINDDQESVQSISPLPQFEPKNRLLIATIFSPIFYRLTRRDYWIENEGWSILTCDEWYHTVKVEIFYPKSNLQDFTFRRASDCAGILFVWLM